MLVVAALGAAAFGQEAAPDKRAFGVMPNYKTVEPGTDVGPLTAKGKFTIARKDAFDYPILMVTGVLAGISHSGNANPSFGQGAKGYAHRYATGYADQALTTIMVEGAFPALFHHDPRYFRKGTGSTISRVGYATSRVVVNRDDHGRRAFNYSEFLGNGAICGAANLYYPDNRNLSGNLTRFGTFLSTDALGNVLKEFWPDIKKKLVKHN